MQSPSSTTRATPSAAQRAVCYAAPGIQFDLAQAMVETAGRLGKEMLTVSLDFDDRVMRMGYGDIGAVTLLLEAGISVNSSPGLRTALVVVDNEGYVDHGPTLRRTNRDA